MELVREEFISEVNDDGEVVLLDRSKWLLDPNDVTTAFSFQPEAAVRIELVDEGNSYPYELTELGSGISVRAIRVEE